MNYKRAALCLVFVFFIVGLKAQVITGVLTDSVTHEPVPYASVMLVGRTSSGVLTDSLGRFRLKAREGHDKLEIKAVGYRPRILTIAPDTDLNLAIPVVSVDQVLTEVIVKPKKEKYSRKDNPAVELMRKVIAHKKKYKLEENDFYSYDIYEKLTTSLNDIKKEDLDKGIFKKMPFLIQQVEVCPETNKFILPFSIQETASTMIYRKDPKKEKKIIKGINTEGVNELFSTGDIMNTVLADVFTDVDIYDDNIRLLQQRFVSPISSVEAISFYKFYIMDTLQVDNDRCIHLTFVPQNAQDFGFTGHLYVLDDSTYRIKRVKLNLPKNTNVNFVQSLDIIQDFGPLPGGTWGLLKNDMIVELYVLKSLTGMQVRQTTRYTNFSYEQADAQLFDLKGDVVKQDNVMMRDDKFWAEVRDVPLTEKESTMNQFVKNLQQMPGFKYIIFVARALIENFIETGSKGHPSKFDFGPMNTIVGGNSIEGFRARISGQTTANLFPQFFMSGYYAYGFKDHRSKGKLNLEYTFDKKEFLAREYPKHSISVMGVYDLESPEAKFLKTDKDNMFLTLKTTKVDQMSYVRRFEVKYERELRNGFSYSLTASNINDEPAGALFYRKVSGEFVKDMTTSQAQLLLRYSPGEAFINTKQRRITISYDAPVFTLSHTAGINGILGGQYDYNVTELGIWKRFWLSSFGRLDFDVKAGKQWNQVPFPLLIMPAANLSYITQKGTFSLLNNMEFLNDHYASLFVTYDLNGKLLNRIPLIRKLKLREVIKFQGLWGGLSSKNNPMLPGNENLFEFPSRDGKVTSYSMGNTPYIEVAAGIYNIFKIIHVEYVRRLTYLNHPDIHKWGIRLAVMMNF